MFLQAPQAKEVNLHAAASILLLLFIFCNNSPPALSPAPPLERAAGQGEGVLTSRERHARGALQLL